MKKTGYITLLVLFIYSCGSLKLEKNDIIGEYNKRQTSENALSVNYNLILKADNTFSLSMKIQDANPKCNGKWELRDNYVYLKCEESENIGEVLSSSYMKEKDHKLEVMNRNRIKFRDVVLKRK